jgi:hypothetical protein
VSEWIIASVVLVSTAVSVGAAVFSAQFAAQNVSLLIRITRLETQVRELQRQVDKWKRKYYALCNWVQTQGLRPPDNGVP